MLEYHALSWTRGGIFRPDRANRACRLQYPYTEFHKRGWKEPLKQPGRIRCGTAGNSEMANGSGITKGLYKDLNTLIHCIIRKMRNLPINNYFQKSLDLSTWLQYILSNQPSVAGSIPKNRKEKIFALHDGVALNSGKYFPCPVRDHRNSGFHSAYQGCVVPGGDLVNQVGLTHSLVNRADLPIGDRATNRIGRSEDLEESDR